MVASFLKLMKLFFMVSLLLGFPFKEFGMSDVQVEDNSLEGVEQDMGTVDTDDGSTTEDGGNLDVGMSGDDAEDSSEDDQELDQQDMGMSSNTDDWSTTGEDSEQMMARDDCAARIRMTRCTNPTCQGKYRMRGIFNEGDHYCLRDRRTSCCKRAQ